MKKEKIFTVFFIMCIVLMVSLTLVSASYAKYITNASSGDSATVAIWGVNINADSSKLFNQTYEKDEGNFVVNATSNVVAPGTSGIATFEISGSPETSSIIMINFSAGSDVFLIKGTYLDLTTDNVKDDVFYISEDYYPIVYTLEVKEGSNAPIEIAKGTLKTIETALNESVYNNQTFAPGQSIDKVFTLKWQWASNKNNNADTWIGVSKAKGVQDLSLEQGVDYSFTVMYEFEITVIQIQ